LIAWTDQITAAVIATEIVSFGGDSTRVIEDVFTRCAGLQDCVSHHQRRGVIDAAPAVPAELPLTAVFSVVSPLPLRRAEDEGEALRRLKKMLS